MGSGFHEAILAQARTHEKRMYLESQWLIIMGYFGSFLGYFGVEWPSILGYLTFQVFSPAAGPFIGKQTTGCGRAPVDLPARVGSVG